jgi:hypothetical protein
MRVVAREASEAEVILYAARVLRFLQTRAEHCNKAVSVRIIYVCSFRTGSIIYTQPNLFLSLSRYGNCELCAGNSTMYARAVRRHRHGTRNRTIQAFGSLLNVKHHRTSRVHCSNYVKPLQSWWHRKRSGVPATLVLCKDLFNTCCTTDHRSTKQHDLEVELTVVIAIIIYEFRALRSTYTV